MLPSCLKHNTSTSTKQHTDWKQRPTWTSSQSRSNLAVKKWKQSTRSLVVVASLTVKSASCAVGFITHLLLLVNVIIHQSLLNLSRGHYFECTLSTQEHTSEFRIPSTVADSNMLGSMYFLVPLDCRRALIGQGHWGVLRDNQWATLSWLGPVFLPQWLVVTRQILL